MRLALILEKCVMLSLRYTIIKVAGSHSFTSIMFQSLNIELNAHESNLFISRNHN